MEAAQLGEDRTRKLTLPLPREGADAKNLDTA
jgi:hypothetical protein